MAQTKITSNETDGTLLIKRQNDTINTSLVGARIETGWGYIPISNAGGVNYNKNIVFGTSFTGLPIVLISCGGDALSAAGTTYGTGGNQIVALWGSKATNVVAGGFTAYITASAAVGATGNVWYQWIAIGV